MEHWLITEYALVDVNRPTIRHMFTPVRGLDACLVRELRLSRTTNTFGLDFVRWSNSKPDVSCATCLLLIEANAQGLVR